MTSLSEDMELSKLTIAECASLDSYANQYEKDCLADTRTDLQPQIIAWAKKPSGKFIFWLNGMAGIAKSTVSSTLTQNAEYKHCILAAYAHRRFFLH